MIDTERKWFEINPGLGESQPVFLSFCRKLQKQIASGPFPRDEMKKLQKQMSLRPGPQAISQIKLLLVQNVVLDLVAQGWLIKVVGQTVRIHAPIQTSGSPEQEKARVRHGHLIERDSQLSKKSVAEFVRSMEAAKLTEHGWRSIFSVMRDGQELKQILRKVTLIPEAATRERALRSAVLPYLQFVEGDAVCEHTGLRLRDIWRYFRLTWVNHHKSIPGRSILILIRDAAAAHHPVIGIAAIGSSVVQQKVRDQQIGWDSSSFLARLTETPSVSVIRRLHTALDELLAGLYIDDLLADPELELQRRHVSQPTHSIIEGLRKESKAARKRHQNSPHLSVHKSTGVSGSEDRIDWLERAETDLFRSKRCRHLAALLSIRKVFQEHKFTPETKKLHGQALQSGQVRSAIGQLVRLMKAEHVGIDMLDITVCGAVAPYNLLLGGKLVCMLLGSPEITAYYKAKYSGRSSIIASSMKAAPVRRRHSLVLLCTTSLYGVGSSQYNRIKVPAETLGGEEGEFLEFIKLGYSVGFGSFHFSGQTLQWINFVLGRKGNRRVNSIFGEGVNPLMRKIREALDYVGLPGDDILWHGNKRVIYSIPLASNYKEILLGLAKKPKYFVPPSNPKARTELLATFWRNRWLASRLKTTGIVDKVGEHSLTFPVRHGARVGSSVPFENLTLWEFPEQHADEA
jgi:hypothetical protein